MTRKQRIQAVLEKKVPDAVPYHCNLTSKIKSKLANYFTIPADQVEQHVGNHLLYVSFHEPTETDSSRGSSPLEPSDPKDRQWSTYNVKLHKTEENTLVDEFGITWDNEATYDAGDWGMVDHPVKNMQYEDYAFPDGSAPGRFDGVETIIEQNPDRFNVVSMIGLFDTAWHVTGIQDLLMGMAMEDAKFVNTMLDNALAFNIGVIEQIPDFIDGVRFMEDWGQQKGLIMGLENWRRFLKPRLREMYGAVKKKGCAVMSHSCGDISELYPDLIELGVNVSDPLQPEVMNINEIKKQYGRDIVLFGGLGCQSTLPYGTPEEVVEEAKDRVTALGQTGGYILGSAGSIPTDVPVENVVALYKYCKSMVGETL